MFWLILSIVLWGVVHSIMASLGFKEFLRRVLGNELMRAYRLFYNLFSVISFSPILYLMVVLPNMDLYQVASPWSYLLLVGQGLSVILLFVTVLQTDTLSFVGLRQLIQEEKQGKLITSGFYRYIRHPLYTFGLLILWLSPSVTVNSFVVYVSLTIYILLGAFFEERKLIREYGDAYAEYKVVTPMLIPGLKFGGNK